MDIPSNMDYERDNMLGIVAALKELTVTGRSGQGGEDKHKNTEY